MRTRWEFNHKKLKDMEKITKQQTQEEVKVHAKYVCEYCETCNRVWQAATQLIRGKWAGKKLDKRFTNELNAMFADELFEIGDGRIITEKVLSGIEQAMDGNNERIFRLQDAAKNYKKHLQAYDKAKRQFLDAVGKINPMFVESDVRTYEIGAPWRVQMEQQIGTYQKQYIYLQ